MSLIRQLTALWRSSEVIKALVARDIKARYRKTALGFSWALLQPLLMVIVFSEVFSSMVKPPIPGVPYYVFIFAGLLPWNFLVSGLGFGSTSVVSHATLLTKVKFPGEILPISAVVSNLLDYAIGLIILLLITACLKLGWHWSFLLLPVVLAAEFLFVLSVVFLFSAVNVFYRDVRYIVPFVTMLWMFLTPVFYPISSLKPSLQTLVQFNPMLWMVDMHRSILLLGTMPDMLTLAADLGASLVLFLMGYALFKRWEPWFAETI